MNPSGPPAGGGPPGGRLYVSGDDRLEGILDLPGPVPAAGTPMTGVVAAGVVVAHPHPLYGGTMAQPVVYRVAKTCQERGLAALRFNFRGVGGSAGRYSGRDEYRDVEAALAFLRGRLAAAAGEGTRDAAVPARPGGRRPALAVAGYSFGSVMAAMAAGGTAAPVDALVLIAFVVGWDEAPADLLARLGRFRGPVLAVCGELDDLAPPAAVDRALKELRLDYRLRVIERAGHLFEDKQREVGELVGDFLAEVLRVRRPPV